MKRKQHSTRVHSIFQLADLQWMHYWQNDLVGYIFGEITAIAGEYTSYTSKNTFNNWQTTSKIDNFTSILLRNDNKHPIHNLYKYLQNLYNDKYASLNSFYPFNTISPSFLQVSHTNNILHNLLWYVHL